MARGVRAARTRVETEGLLVRRSPFGEADLVVTFFTEARGLVSAVARSARRSQKRFGTLEPMHTLALTLDEREGRDLASLVEARVQQPRMGILADLDRLEAAGHALRWLRSATPPGAPDPDVYRLAVALLDALAAPARAEGVDAPRPDELLASAGLRLLATSGWALDLERCVRCGKAADPSARASLDPAAGGLVCRACGGARDVLSAETRAALRSAAAGTPRLSRDDAALAVSLVDAALKAHGA